jgi:hypothetical protein
MLVGLMLVRLVAKWFFVILMDLGFLLTRVSFIVCGEALLGLEICSCFDIMDPTMFQVEAL